MKTNTHLPIHAVSALSLAIGLICSPLTHAASQLETVIVTASKIETDIQQTPVSMQSISGEKLEALGAGNLLDIAKFTPSLQLEQAGGGNTATVRVRGIGTPGNSALDPSVPVFIDGVAQARTGAGFQDLLDVARVEVLRGPQGTLYGRNSTAGAINVWTKDASTRNWEGSIQAQVGNYNDRELKGTVNVPIADNIMGARISAFSVKQDGYIDNEMDDKTYNGYADRQGGRSKVLLVPTDNVDVIWITDYSEAIGHPAAMVKEYAAGMTALANAGRVVSNPNLSGATLQSNGLPVPDPYSDKTYFDISSWNKDTNFATSVTANWDISEGFLADHSMTFISSYQKYKTTQFQDSDYTPLAWSSTSGEATARSHSQELRISSDASENWEYVGGLFYFTEDLKSDQNTDNVYADRLASLAVGQRATNSASHTKADTKNAAIFGQATYQFTDQFSVSLGLRQSWVKKRSNSGVDVAGRINVGVLFPFTTSLTLIDDESQIEHDTSGILKARYFLDENAMLYASFDRGFKPGGFNRIVSVGANPPPTTYKKENSNNFEVGAKTQWLDNHLQANIAAFHMDFTDYHNQVTDAATTNVIVENIKSVTTDGVEIDVQALLGTNFTTGAAVAYLNPRVNDDSVRNGQDVGSRDGRSAVLENGQLINDASQYSGNLFAEYTYPINGAQGFIRADLSYRSSFVLAHSTDLGMTTEVVQGGYSTSNLRFGVRKLDNHWQFSGWVKNLTDKEYATSGQYGIGNVADGSFIYPGAPRTYGATVQYDY